MNLNRSARFFATVSCEGRVARVVCAVREGRVARVASVRAMWRTVLAVVVLGFWAFLVSGCGGEDTTASDQAVAPLTSVDDTAPDQTDAVDAAAAPAPVMGVVTEYPDAEREHVLTEVAYAVLPPVGGDHFPVWQNCGFYRQPLMDELAVHALEHGAVWIAYRPDTDDAILALIEARVAEESHLLASPYPGLDAPLVLSAWERQLKVSSWDDPSAESFIDGHLARRSPTAPEAGASCADGIGTPPDDPLTQYQQALEYFQDN